MTSPAPPTGRIGSRPEPGIGATGAPAVRALPMVAAQPCRWGETACLLVGAGSVLTGAAMLTPGYGGVAGPVAAAAVIAVTGTSTLGWRVNRRRRALAAATNLISHQLRAPIVIERARWRGRPVGDVVAVSLRYTELAALGYGELLPAQLAQACSRAFGRPFRTVDQSPAKSQIKLAAAVVNPTPDMTELERQQQRVRGVVTETFGNDATVAALATNQDDTITRFTVHYRSAAAKVTVAAVRRRITNAPASARQHGPGRRPGSATPTTPTAFTSCHHRVADPNQDRHPPDKHRGGSGQPEPSSSRSGGATSGPPEPDGSAW